MASQTVLQLLGPSTGGIRRHVGTLAKGLEERGWRAPIAGPPDVMNGVAAQSHALPMNLSTQTMFSARHSIRRIAEAETPNLIHAHGLKAGWLASLAKLDVPVLVTVHNVVLRETAGRSAPVLRLLERLLPRRVDHVIAVSNEIADRLPGRQTVIPPAGPVPTAEREPGKVRESYHMGNDQPLVVTVARLHPQKDLFTLLAAAAEVKAAVQNVRFIVVGEGPERDRLETRRDELGLSETVTFVGYRPNPADEMNAADVVVLSSRWEGSPLVVIETFRLGRPVVATAVGAVPEAVIDKQTGRLVPPGDPPSLAGAIIDVLTDTVGSAQLAEAGMLAARKQFDPDLLIDRVVTVYEDLIQK